MRKAFSITELLIVIAVMGVLVACLVASQTPKSSDGTISMPYKTQVIEGCEYLATQSHMGYWQLTHKGNCTNSIHQYRIEK